MQPKYGPRAIKHLKKVDRLLTKTIEAVGPFRPNMVPDRFPALAYSIISQQISIKAAASIRQKVLDLLAPQPLSPLAILKQRFDDLRSAGLSKAKATYLLDLADKVHSKQVVLDDLHQVEDEQVIANLIQVKGIGRWTAEMFLIFSLGRPNVLPVDDLGLKAAVRKLYRLPELPTKAELKEMGAAWNPYCSVATWYLWQSLKLESKPAQAAQPKRASRR